LRACLRQDTAEVITVDDDEELAQRHVVVLGEARAQLVEADDEVGVLGDAVHNNHDGQLARRSGLDQRQRLRAPL
jgi:hypothetical protein